MKNPVLTELRKEKPWLRSRDLEKKPEYYKRYKQKECPVCHKLHKGYTTYCSHACKNRGRIITEKIRDNMSKGMREYIKTPEGTAHRKLVFTTRKHEDYLTDIPSLELIDMIISQ
jgi:galactose-1-phosphate uridylyltransferase